MWARSDYITTGAKLSTVTDGRPFLASRRMRRTATVHSWEL